MKWIIKERILSTEDTDKPNFCFLFFHTKNAVTLSINAAIIMLWFAAFYKDTHHKITVNLMLLS